MDADGVGQPSGDAEQLTLAADASRSRRPPPPEGLAAVDPVARVVVDVPLPHLDRPFEYAVPESMAATAVPGARVRVRFAGQDVEGFVLARTQVAEHEGRLAPLRRVVSDEQVLGPGELDLARAVADHWAGVLPDVLRLAVPPRSAAGERRPPAGAAPPPDPPAPGPWQDYPAGPAFVARLSAGGDPRAVWTALPGRAAGRDWPDALAVAAAAALASGRGAVVVVPDHGDVVRVDAALTALLGRGRHVRLTADQGTAARYTAWLALRRGDVRAVVGTRAAMFAPVADVGLLAVWDDGDDSLVEPHAPYPHVRDVLALRAGRERAALLVGGHVRTAQTQAWLTSGWARALEAPRDAVRRSAPRVVLPGEDTEAARDAGARSARLPSLAFRAAREALGRGPVLVQVPRRGYVPTVACQRCRAHARCRTCHGPLGLSSGHAVPACRWCGRPDGAWACDRCGGRSLRSLVVGQGRTAEELGRAFPGVLVRRSGGDEVLAAVDDAPALVVATPGAEPVAAGGYAAALLLDGWALLDRADLRAGEEALRRWAAAAALVRPAADGGTVVLHAPAGLPPVEALVRWDPAWHAARELAERTELGFPPAAAVATLTGDRDAVAALLGHARLPPGAEVLGPVPVADGAVRAVVRTPVSGRDALAAALKAATAARSARKEPGAVRVALDPVDLV